MATYQEYLKGLPVGSIFVKVLGFGSQPKIALLLEVHEDWAFVSFKNGSFFVPETGGKSAVALSQILVEDIE